MNILKKFEVKDTHERIRSDFNKGFATQVERLGIHPQDPWNKVYEYKTLLRVRFTANDASYDMALENAKRQTQQFVYSEVLFGLQMIQTCVYNGDARATLEEIQKLGSLILDIE